MNFEQQRSLRKSMTWLHTWTGLLAGWLLFAIFVTGTLSFYRNEISDWMTPETLQASRDSHDQGLPKALALLQQRAGNASQWDISLPSSRNSLYRIRWRNADEEMGRANVAPATAAAITSAPINPATINSEVVAPNVEQRNTDHSSVTKSAAEPREDKQHGPRQHADTDLAANTDTGAAPWAERRASFRAQTATNAHQDQQNSQGQQDTTTEHYHQGHRPATDAEGQHLNAAMHGEANRQGNTELSVKAPAETNARTTARPSRGGFQELLLNPDNGDIITPRQTAGGEFLYRFHFQLYGMPIVVGRTLVGIATMMMFIAIISGVIMHRNIFVDFFTFRPGRNKRAWTDAHGITSVAALPFHLVLTFSGLLLLGTQLMPLVAGAAYSGTENSFRRDLHGGGRDNAPSEQATTAPLTDIAALLRQARTINPDGVSQISVNHPGRSDAKVSITLEQSDLSQGRRGLQTLEFDGVTGQALPVDSQERSVAAAIWGITVGTHLGLFAMPLTRSLLFISGVLGATMVATGLVMWLVAREKEAQRQRQLPRGHRWVQALNVSAIAGLFIALGAYFWANRILPVTLEDRPLWEIRVFFLCWGLTLVHAILRSYRQAWLEQLLLGAVLLGLLPLLNGFSGGAFIWQSLARGQYPVAGFDLVALLLGASLLLCAKKIWRSKTANELPQSAKITGVTP